MNAKTFENNENRRAEMSRRLPDAVQPFLTFATGKAGDEPAPRKVAPTRALLFNLATLWGGAMMTGTLLYLLPRMHWALQGPTLLVAFLAMLPTAGAVRAGSSVMLHHATHLNFETPAWWMRLWNRENRWLSRKMQTRLEKIRASLTPEKAWNRILGETQSVIALLAPFTLYKTSHDLHHKALTLATFNDPDWRFLERWGFAPGRPRRWYWKKMWQTLLSPSFHAAFLSDRLYDNFLNPDAPRYRRAMAWGFWLMAGVAVGGGVAAGGIGVLWAFLAGYIFPITLLGNANALLQLLTEHQWLRADDSDDRLIRLDRKTRARYIGPALPDERKTGLSAALAWTGWWARLLAETLVCRLYILPSDLPSHGWHHRHAGSKDWPNVAYAMRDEIAAGMPGWTEPYAEDWGLPAMLNGVFGLLSSLPPQDGPPAPLKRSERRDIFRTM